MGKIKLLSEDLISLISAGEVIENPSSIVKELIENSLDAGTDMIDISIQAGGIDRIVVSDNGSGISGEDCEVCLQRHSTSKVSTKEDIDAISTYGFRGEALASIATVADVRITTQTQEEEVGTLIVSRVGEDPKISDSSRPIGTTVEVNDLFKKIPVRRKHLGSSKAEGQRILEVVMKHAVIRTDVGFRLIKDEEVVIDCPPMQSSIDRIAYLWGSDIAKGLVEIYYFEEGVWVQGFAAMPPVSRGNRSREYFAVVRRPISDERLSHAVESAYSTFLMKGQYPICALDIAMNLADVDVNVHPTKREVRILDLEKVSSIITKAVREALGVDKPQVESQSLETFLDEGETSSVKPAGERVASTSGDTQRTVPLVEQTILEPLTDVGEDEDPVNLLGGVFRIIGQVHQLYILLEDEEGLLIIDQHAAHERLLYEELRKEVNENRVAVQELLQPFVLSLSPTDTEQILELSGKLEELGFSISSFGGNEVSISAVPEIFGKVTSETELISLLDRMTTIGVSEAHDSFMDELVKLTACHSAMRAGQTLNVDEIRSLIEDFSRTQGKYTCCHGRPSMIRIRKDNLDKAVGRLGHEAIQRFQKRHQIG
ncbi:MAG: DNA mismatch repair endonuclease MutL [Candidatus Thorarchaeota archaeon]|nr:DNA mismatch repair endonuclease MutL [Candidatus Thorarchaeota archaeon]